MPSEIRAYDPPQNTGLPGLAGDWFVREILSDGRIVLEFRDTKAQRRYRTFVGNKGKTLVEDINRAIAATGTPVPPPVVTPPSNPPDSTIYDKDYSADTVKVVNNQPIWPYPELQRQPGPEVSSVRVIQSPMDPARKAYEFSQALGSTRCEFADWHSADTSYTEGEKYTFYNDYWISSGQPEWDPSSHHSFMQLHAGSPTENTIFGVGIRTTWPDKAGFGAVPPGGGGFEMWVPRAEMTNKKLKIKIEVLFASVNGYVKCWFNDELKYNKNYNTNPSGTVYLKEGLYGNGNGNKLVSHGFKRSK